MLKADKYAQALVVIESGIDAIRDFLDEYDRSHEFLLGHSQMDSVLAVILAERGLADAGPSMRGVIGTFFALSHLTGAGAGLHCSGGPRAEFVDAARPVHGPAAGASRLRRHAWHHRPRV